MMKLVNNKTERDPSYHEFEYVDGKKIPKPKDGLVRFYLAESTENGRMLKATTRVDIAGSVDGKYVETDEFPCINGAPEFKGKPMNIWGIGRNYVITSVNGDKFFIAADEDNKTVVVHHNHEDKKEAYTILHKIYTMLI